jgi:hypothetical protein
MRVAEQPAIWSTNGRGIDLERRITLLEAR